MDELGLYLPPLFKYQLYSNVHDLPFREYQKGYTFIKKEHLNEMLKKNEREFNYLTLEMALRGGKFLGKEDSLNYPKYEINNNTIISVSRRTPVDAYKNLNLNMFNLDYIVRWLDIKSNSFFHSIPVDGFKTFHLDKYEISMLINNFKKAGFEIKTVSDDLIFMPQLIEKLTKTSVNRDIDKKNSLKPKEVKLNSLNIVHKNENKYGLYFSTSYDRERVPLPRWATFFIEIGRYLEESDEVSIYVNYLDDIMPSTFVALGILDSIYKRYEDKFFLEEWINKNIRKGQEVSYIYEEKKNKAKFWRKATVVDVKHLDYMNEKFNPYVILEVNLPKKQKVIDKVPKTQIMEKIRIGGNVRNTAGSRVFIDDRLNKRFRKLFSNHTVDIIKFTNQQHINLIGHGKRNCFEKFAQQISIYGSDVLGEEGFKLSDWFYFESTSNNLANLNMINSESSIFNNNNINIFIGANTSLRYYNFSNKKNIYLVDRLDISNDSAESLSVNLMKDTMLGSKDVTLELLKYLEESKVLIPKGVELFAFRKV